MSSSAARSVANALRGGRSAARRAANIVPPRAPPLRAAPLATAAASPAQPEDAAAQREELRAAVRELTGWREGTVPTRDALRAALPADHPYMARKTLPSWDALAVAVVEALAARQTPLSKTKTKARPPKPPPPAAAAPPVPPPPTTRRAPPPEAPPAAAPEAEAGPRHVALVPLRPLRPYQAAGVDFICARDATLLADEMGLGKTVQALAALAQRQAFPALVICPAFLKTNWAREAAAWLPDARVQVLEGSAAVVKPGFDLTVVNYDILSKHVGALCAMQLKALILDESQYIKNPEAQRTEAALKLAAKARRQGSIVLLLSGTPVLNRPVELVPQLEALGKSSALASSQLAFKQRYCDPHAVLIRVRGRLQTHFDYSGASNTGELNEKLLASGFFLRRLKCDVLSELPPKTRAEVLVSLPPKSRKEYDASVKAIKSAGEDKVRGMMSSLRNQLALFKLPLVQTWIDGFLASADPSRKLIVFAHHAALVDGIAARYEGNLRVRGSDSPAARQAAVDTFQNGGAGGPRVISCNIAAAGVGLTLTAATDVLFAELAWAPMANAQAEDRAHRIGQLSSVQVTTILAEGTIDMVVARVVDAKRRVVDSAVDGGRVPPPRPPIGGYAPAAAPAQEEEEEEDDAELGESSVEREVAKDLGLR